MAAQVVVLLGAPGAGKGTQAQELAGGRGWLHLSSGELLRAAHDVRLDQIMDSGELVPDADVEELVRKAIAAASTEQGIILDGFPRSVAEAKWLDGALDGMGRHVSAVVLLEITRDVMQKRLSLRGRPDDTAASQAERWTEFESQTLPVADFYAASGLLRRVDGEGSAWDVAARVKEALA